MSQPADLMQAVFTVGDAATYSAEQAAIGLLDWLTKGIEQRADVVERKLVRFGFELIDCSPSDRLSIWQRGCLQVGLYQSFDSKMCVAKLTIIENEASV